MIHASLRRRWQPSASILITPSILFASILLLLLHTTLPESFHSTFSSTLLLVQADQYELDYRREFKNTLIFGEPKFVRAIGMYADGDTQVESERSYIQLRLYAHELTEQLRLVDPYENLQGFFNDTSFDASSKKLIDELNGVATSDYTQPGFIQAIIMQAQDLDLLGLPDADSPLNSIETYCCTPFYVDQGLCPERDLGSIIIDRNVSAYDIWVYDIPLLPRQSSTEPGKWIERRSTTARTAKEDHRATYHVSTTGEHILILSHCDPTLNTEIAVTGMTEWRNPFGFLPGRLFGFLKFHKVMLLGYFLFGVVWLGASLQHWKEFTSLQFYTSIVIFLCVLEQLTWFSEYDHFNQIGSRSFILISIGIGLTVLRQTLSRMLIVSVALGYQLVKPTLGDNKIRLLVLGGAYFVGECSLEFVIRYQQTHPLNDFYRILLTVPVSVINAIFYWWIFVSLYQLMQHLEERKQDAKFSLYKSFTNVLLFSVIAAILFACYQGWFMLTGQFAWHWSYLWVVDGGFTSILYAVILVSIAILFRPSSQMSRFSYSSVGTLDDDDLDESHLELVSKGSPNKSPRSSPTSSSAFSFSSSPVDNLTDDEHEQQSLTGRG